MKLGGSLERSRRRRRSEGGDGGEGDPLAVEEQTVHVEDDAADVG